MLDIFQYDFMIRAFIAGAITAVIAPTIGTFLVARRYSLIADSFAHIALAGVAIGLLLKIYPIYAALAVVLVAAFAIERLRAREQVSGDALLAIFLSGGLAIAVVLIGLARGFNADLLSYLFGSIATVTATDILVMAILGAVIFVMVFLLYKELAFTSFDSEVAATSGVPVGAINTILIIATAVTVVLSMRIIGILLIGALIVIPVSTAMQLARSFKQIFAIAIGFSLASVMLGIFFSFYFDLAAGGTIVLILLAIFALVLSLKSAVKP
ncbi:metal ABC transporter permease [bacterium]|nr:MAG: metal ABC transporter permease [bacterium]